MYNNRPYKCRQNVIQYLCIWQGRKGGGGGIHYWHECDQKMKVVNKTNLNLINPIDYTPNKMSSSVNKITMCK